MYERLVQYNIDQIEYVQSQIIHCQNTINHLNSQLRDLRYNINYYGNSYLNINTSGENTESNTNSEIPINTNTNTQSRTNTQSNINRQCTRCNCNNTNTINTRTNVNNITPITPTPITPINTRNVNRSSYNLRNNTSRNIVNRLYNTLINESYPYSLYEYVLTDNNNVRNRRLTQRQINISTRVTSYGNIQNPINQECPISLTSFQENDIVRQIIHCGHIFNINELSLWFESNHVCPVCRYDITTYVNVNTEQSSLTNHNINSQPSEYLINGVENLNTEESNDEENNNEGEGNIEQNDRETDNTIPSIEQSPNLSPISNISNLTYIRDPNTNEVDSIIFDFDISSNDIINNLTNIASEFLNIPINNQSVNRNIPTSSFFNDASNNILLFETIFRNIR